MAIDTEAIDEVVTSTNPIIITMKDGVVTGVYGPGNVTSSYIVLDPDSYNCDDIDIDAITDMITSEYDMVEITDEVNIDKWFNSEDGDDDE